jgi:ankyrin repeat protein
MPSFLNKLKALASPSSNRKAKSTGDLSHIAQLYTIKEKDLPKLHLSAWQGNLNKVIELCRPDKLNLIDKEGRTPLHLAIVGNHLNVVDHLLKEGAKIQAVDKSNRTSLILASIVGNPNMMELLLNNLDHNNNLINMPDNSGLNPLLYAIKNTHINLLQVLLREKGINLDFQDKVRKKQTQIRTTNSFKYLFLFVFTSSSKRTRPYTTQ